MLNLICQIGVATFGISAVFLIARKNKWGFVLGVLGEPFWLISFILHRQWGMLAIGVIYTINWIYGIKVWFKKDSNKE